MSERKTRSDAFDGDSYRDTGCPDGALPSCLNCPLPACRYDMHRGLTVMLNVVRDRSIRQDRREGLTAEEIAERRGVSIRTVFRVIEGAAKVVH
jgi:hypothetical protein